MLLCSMQRMPGMVVTVIICGAINSIFFFFLVFSRAALVANGGSQARGQIGAVATSPKQSYNNTGSKLGLRPTPQLTAMLDP